MAEAGALDGLVVLDLTDEQGDACGRILADLGADVIKVEPPGGSPARKRSWAGFDESGTGYDWLTYNLNKRSAVLDLEDPRHVEAFKRLVASADCVVESFEPGYLAARGLGYEHLRTLNGDIVLTSISPFGQAGARAGTPATDLTVVAEGGVIAAVGAPGRSPLRMSYPQARFWAGMHGASSTLLALTDAELTGRPHWVDVSILECGPWFMIASPDRPRTPGVSSRRGVWRGMGAGQVPQVIPCKDGYVNYSINAGPIAAVAQTRLVQWMDREGMCPDWLREFDFAAWDGSQTTKEFCDGFSQALVAFFATKTRKELGEFALANGLFLAGIRNFSEVLNEPPFSTDDELWWPVDEPGGAPVVPGTWILMSETPLAMQRPAPQVGEHTAEVLRDLAGLDGTEIEAIVGSQQQAGAQR